MSQVTAVSGTGSVPVTPRRKAVLFCPRCGHESTVLGDWELVVRDDGTEIHCPTCRRQLAFRPR